MFFRRLYRRIRKRLIIRFRGPCAYFGHSWKMRKGWQSNPEWNEEESFRLTGNAFAGMAKEWIHYTCRRPGCDAIAEKERSS